MTHSDSVTQSDSKRHTCKKLQTFNISALFCWTLYTGKRLFLLLLLVICPYLDGTFFRHSFVFLLIVVHFCGYFQSTDCCPDYFAFCMSDRHPACQRIEPAVSQQEEKRKRRNKKITEIQRVNVSLYLY